MDEQQRFDAGMQVRRAVLGDAHVDRAQARRTELTSDFQDLITRYAWGEIWTRSGLPRHTRSLMTICMMVALNREEELRLHLRAASNNGITRDEMIEHMVGRPLDQEFPARDRTPGETRLEAVDLIGQMVRDLQEVLGLVFQPFVSSHQVGVQLPEFVFVRRFRCEL